MEGEEGSAESSEWSGDRIHIDLPEIQQELLEEVCGTGKPVILVLLSGSPLAVNWAQDHVPAILEAWYPGEEGGTALAAALFGDYSPAGRLPVTFVKSLDQLPPFTDYSMKRRTYRYLETEPLYPFGFGLSYTTFRYSDLDLNAATIEAGQELSVRVTVTNTGAVAGRKQAGNIYGYTRADGADR
jgi:beta-glucosidase